MYSYPLKIKLLFWKNLTYPNSLKYFMYVIVSEPSYFLCYNSKT